jgi:2-polyprenyl-6-methoxyphenol hydroxylase-like FAD-dependent oxidoreductase
MNIDHSTVVVGGAGIGGMAAALLLARAGASVTLVERAPEITAVGAGILLQPNGIAVLAGLGLDERLRSAGCRVDNAVIRALDGRPVSTMYVPDFGPALDQLLAIRRSSLHETLFVAVQAEPRIHLVLGATIGAADPAGGVTTTTGHRIEADLVVGADGVHSAVRGCGDFAPRVRETGDVYLRGLVPVAHLDQVGEYWTPLGLFGGAPVDSTTAYFYASVAAPEVRSAVANHDLGRLRAAWATVLPAAAQVLDAVASFDDLLVNEVVRVDCARWHSGRLVLLGDAAHAMAPTAGQGANSALVDAAVLVAELSADRPVEDSLARYTARRRPAVRRVQDRADQLTRLAHLRSPLARRLRDAVLGWLGTKARSQSMVRATQQEDPATLLAMVRELAQG